jgi:hypothetical protein
MRLLKYITCVAASCTECTLHRIYPIHGDNICITTMELQVRFKTNRVHVVLLTYNNGTFPFCSAINVAVNNSYPATLLYI